MGKSTQHQGGERVWGVCVCGEWECVWGNVIQWSSCTWAKALRSPDEVPSDSGYVISTANSKPMGRYPVMKNLLHTRSWDQTNIYSSYISLKLHTPPPNINHVQCNRFPFLCFFYCVTIFIIYFFIHSNHTPSAMTLPPPKRRVPHVPPPKHCLKSDLGIQVFFFLFGRRVKALYPRAPAVKKTTRRWPKFSVKVNTSIPRKDRMYTSSVVSLCEQRNETLHF